MRIYTSNTYGQKLEQVKELGMGVMIASTPSGYLPTKEYAGAPCALDNGAYQCWQKGYPFMEKFFWRTLEKCYELGLDLDFIVCPDLVTRGLDSLRFSLRYATERLQGCPRLALAVQDGMMPAHLGDDILSLFSHIFVGGSVEWKWKTGAEWVEFAHEHEAPDGKPVRCHIGRCGTLEALDRAEAMGADSVDSANFTRNDSLGVVKRFLSGAASALFECKPGPDGYFPHEVTGR